MSSLAIADHFEWGAIKDASELRVGDQSGADKGNLQGGGIRFVADQRVADGERGAVGGPAHGNAQIAAMRTALIHDERAKAGMQQLKNGVGFQRRTHGAVKTL